MKITCVLLSIYAVSYFKKTMTEANSNILSIFHHSRIPLGDDARSGDSSDSPVRHLRTCIHPHVILSRPPFHAMNYICSWKVEEQDEATKRKILSSSHLRFSNGHHYVIGSPTDSYLDRVTRSFEIDEFHLRGYRRPASVPCLGTQERTHFYPKISPANYISLGNVSVWINDPILTSILESYYDFALLKISQLIIKREQDLCFCSLNDFMFDFIGNTVLPSRSFSEGTMEPNLDVYLWKLWTAIGHRLHKPFANNRFRSVEYAAKRCNLPVQKIVINIESGSNMVVVVHNNAIVDKLLYAEEGCLEFFEQNALYGLGDFIEGGAVDLSAVHYTPDGNVHFVLDGTNVMGALERAPDILMQYYRCKMLEITSIKNLSERLCYTSSLHQNLLLFITKLKNRLVVDCDKQDGISRAWIIRRLNMVRVLLRQEAPLPNKTFISEATTTTTTLTIDQPTVFWSSVNVSLNLTYLASRYGYLRSGSTNYTAETIPLTLEVPTEYTTWNPDENLNTIAVGLEAVHTHIVLSITILLGVLFVMVLFVGLFITWLYCVSRLARVRQQQQNDDV